MGFLFLAVACSLGIATLFKVAERRDLDRTALLAVNYAAAAVLAVVLQGSARGLGGVEAGVVGLGVVQGVLFIGGFWLFSLAIREAGIGLAAGAMRLSVVVSVLASWAIWAEAPTPLQGVGLALAAAAFVLVARPAGASAGDLSASVVAEAPAAAAPAVASADAMRPGRVVLLLVALFVSGGLVDVLMKAFQTGYGARVPSATFLLIVFGVAFAVGAAGVAWTGVRTGRWPPPQIILWGVGLGVVNYGSAEFFLRALGTLPAPVAFPLNSVSIVLGAAAIGAAVWHERFSRANVAGLALAAVAIFLLAG